MSQSPICALDLLGQTAMLRQQNGESDMFTAIRAIDARQGALVVIALVLASTLMLHSSIIALSLEAISAHFGRDRFGAAALVSMRGVAGIPGIIIGVGLALLADRYGRKYWLIGAALVVALSMIGPSISQSFQFAMAITFLGGFASGLVLPIAIGMICESGPSIGRYGAVILASSASLFFAPFSTILQKLQGSVGWQTQLQILSGVTAITAIAIFALPRIERDLEAPQIRSGMIFSALGKSIGPILLIAFAALVLNMLSIGGTTWSPVLMQRAGLSVETVGIRGFAVFFGIAAMVIFLLSRPSARALALTGLVSTAIIVADVAAMGLWVKWPVAAILALSALKGAAGAALFALSYAALASIVAPIAMTTAVMIVSTLMTTFGMLGSVLISMMMSGETEMSPKMVSFILAAGIPAVLIFGLTLNRYAFLLSDEELLAEPERFS